MTGADLRDLDVIVVDADPSARTALYRALSAAGVKRIRLATAVDHALALCQARRPDAVLTGERMPDGTWRDIATRIGDASRPKASASAADDAARYGLAAGAAAGFAGDLDELLGGTPKASSAHSGVGEGRPIPVLLVTGRPTRDLVGQARDANVAAILMAPLAPQDLLVRLKTAMKTATRDLVEV